MKKGMKIVAIVISIIVTIGWIYSLTASESQLNQAFKAAPGYMNIIGILWFALFMFITFMFGTERWVIKSIQYNSVPVIISLALGVVGGILLAANFFSGIY
jgi:hypothetical protein